MHSTAVQRGPGSNVPCMPPLASPCLPVPAVPPPPQPHPPPPPTPPPPPPPPHTSTTHPPATLLHCCCCRRFTGDPVTAQPDVTELALAGDDEFLVVASDGLWDVLDSQEVIKTARRELGRGASEQAVAAKLAKLAVKRGSQDNVAVVLVDLGNVDWAAAGSGRGGGGMGFLGGLFGR